MNRKTVVKTQRRQGLRARAARKFMTTTDSRYTLSMAPNLLALDFAADPPNTKWTSDITYLPIDEGWLFLATEVDLYPRRVVGWSMASHMQAELECDALKMALWRRKMPSGVIVHSDRCSQYCSLACQALTEKYDLRSSMSRRGCRFDNACAESFFSTLKIEFTHGVRHETRGHLRREVFEYIEGYYNTVRHHSTINYLSPAGFEALEVA